jgi:hypothetical protein
MLNNSGTVSGNRGNRGSREKKGVDAGKGTSEIRKAES